MTASEEVSAGLGVAEPWYLLGAQQKPGKVEGLLGVLAE